MMMILIVIVVYYASKKEVGDILNTYKDTLNRLSRGKKDGYSYIYC